MAHDLPFRTSAHAGNVDANGIAKVMTRVLETDYRSIIEMIKNAKKYIHRKSLQYGEG